MSSEDATEPVEPEQALPWSTSGDGPWPEVTIYPVAGRPVLQVWSAG
ncbi:MULTISPECIES: hypothetical protein [Streptomyces]|uniref:Alpha/beta hydrolase n=1 Tax=Streptomyces doudnae TaxID=3075536 RepID=A0ABD5EG89_9ACTN|nr:MULTISPECIES: hypothetical protein [unclassified Streptomyces]MDT0433293.1 hypothetical protein [Streptomyces sp. DSM 41981]MYQ69238.1 hypothetical protein [Streptomyces sp. SID4950]